MDLFEELTPVEEPCPECLGLRYIHKMDESDSSISTHQKRCPTCRGRGNSGQRTRFDEIQDRYALNVDHQTLLQHGVSDIEWLTDKLDGLMQEIERQRAVVEATIEDCPVCAGVALPDKRCARCQRLMREARTIERWAKVV